MAAVYTRRLAVNRVRRRTPPPARSVFRQRPSVGDGVENGEEIRFPGSEDVGEQRSRPVVVTS